MSSTNDALGRTVSRRGFLARTAIAGAGVAGAGALLSACGGGAGGGGGTGSKAVTWANWANPGEQVRFKEYNTQYMKDHPDVKLTYQTVTGDYLAKLLTQLAGGSAPDVFYIGDTQIDKLITSSSIQPLDDYLAKSSVIKADDTYEGLRQWSQRDGKTYGVAVDCNPAVVWFNKDILSDAGVSQDPAASFEAGAWNREAFQSSLEAIKAKGKTPFVVEAGWFNWWGLVTMQGGKMMSDDGKSIAFDSDAKAKTAIEWMIENLKSGNMVYGGSLPKGQGVDALFYAGQLGYITYGRWILPNLKKLNGKIKYDIAPFPSEDGKTVPSTPIATAAMGMNTKAKDSQAGFDFLAAFVSKDGQKFRLSGGGNAVPSQAGLDDVVTEGNDPAHGAWFTKVAEVGYATPYPLYTNATRSAAFNATIDSLLNPEPLKSMTADKFISSLATFMTK